VLLVSLWSVWVGPLGPRGGLIPAPACNSARWGAVARRAWRRANRLFCDGRHSHG